MPGEFALSESPISVAVPSSAPPPTVDVFPTAILGSDNVKLRFFEPNVPLAVNTRWLAMPRGVYIGFEPSTTTGSDVLTLAISPEHNFSLLKVGSSVEKVMVDIFTDSAVQLDFEGHTAFPSYVVATAEFKEGNITRGVISSRSTAPSGITEVLICQVDKTAGQLSVVPITAATRQQPVASTGQTVGFMPISAVEDLETAISITDEIVDARLSSLTAPPGGTPGVDPHLTLKDRIDDDQSGVELANRLFLRSVSILSNRHESAVGTSFNVSGSFSEITREFSPVITIEPTGSESVEGVLTSPTDTTRNNCFLINDDTAERIIDPVTREPVFGTLSFSSGTVGAGKEITFINASQILVGVNDPFNALQVGDIVLGPPEVAVPAGRFYEIETISGSNNATLKSAFQGEDGVIIDTSFRRFLMNFFTVVGGTASISPTNIRFSAPAFFRTDRPVFDPSLFLKRSGERSSLVDATQVTGGKALLAVDNSKVGAFRTIKDFNSIIGNDFHTMNFINGGAVEASGRPGVVDVSVPGEQGPAGEDQDTGPQGPVGPLGAGLQVNQPFEADVFQDHTVSPRSFTHNFLVDGITTLAHFYGGYIGFSESGTNIGRRITMLEQSVSPATEVTIDVSTSGNAWGGSSKVFLGGCQ